MKNVSITIDIIKHVVKFLFDSNCEDVRGYDVRGKSTYTSYIVIATTKSAVHRKGIIDSFPDFFADHHLERYTDYCLNRSKSETMGEWVLMDFCDLVVHLMNDEMRTFYELEKLWMDATIIE